MLESVTTKQRGKVLCFPETACVLWKEMREENASGIVGDYIYDMSLLYGYRRG